MRSTGNGITVNAIVYAEQLAFRKDHPDPQPGPGEALVEVKLAGICATDLEITGGYMNFAGVLGHEFVGIVAAGSHDWMSKRVVAEINCVCGACAMCQSGLSNHCLKRTVIGIAGRDGCFAERIVVPERNLHEVPDAVSDEEAVFVEPLAAAFQVVKQCAIEKRMRVSVLGSGRLGLLVAQVLSGYGCKLDVIGRNRDSLAFCEKKGIQPVHLDDLNRRPVRDVVVECTGSPAGLELAATLVRPRGTIVLKSTYAEPDKINLSPIVVNEITVLGSRCGPFPEAIAALARKQIDVLSMITKQLPLDRGPEAIELAARPEHLKVMLKVTP